jgi:hypothetical protein
MARLGRALLNAIALLSTATILLYVGATLMDTLGGAATPSPAPVRGHR